DDVALDGRGPSGEERDSAAVGARHDVTGDDVVEDSGRSGADHLDASSPNPAATALPGVSCDRVALDDRGPRPDRDSEAIAGDIAGDQVGGDGGGGGRFDADPAAVAVARRIE